MVTDPTAPKERRAWSACPNCLRDLGAKPFGSEPLYTYCPFCGVPLSHIWWQRILVTALALILTGGPHVGFTCGAFDSLGLPSLASSSCGFFTLQSMKSMGTSPPSPFS